MQIVEWYDELLLLADTPIVRLNRAVAVGEADGAPAGLAALAEVEEHVPRRDAVAAYLHEKNGELEIAARLYVSAALNAPNLAERDHQTRQAAADSTSTFRTDDRLKRSQLPCLRARSTSTAGATASRRWRASSSYMASKWKLVRSKAMYSSANVMPCEP